MRLASNSAWTASQACCFSERAAGGASGAGTGAGAGAGAGAVDGAAVVVVVVDGTAEVAFVAGGAGGEMDDADVTGAGAVTSPVEGFMAPAETKREDILESS